MIRVRYSVDGQPVADHYAQEEADRICSLERQWSRSTFTYSTWNIIDWLRVAVKEGVLPVSQIKLYVDDTEVKIEENGEIHTWPDNTPPHLEIFERLFGGLL